MENDFKTFMSLTEPELVKEIATILKSKNILHNIHDYRKDFDPGLTNNELGKSIDIQLQPKDFKEAEILLNEKIELKDELIDNEHFLFTFSNEELTDVVKNADEWHPLDVKLAKYILKKNGNEITQDHLNLLEKERIEEKSTPEKSAAEWIITGYFFAICGGFLGLFIGNHLINYKKTLPDGSQVYNYCESDKAHGKRILFISALSSMIVTIISVYRDKL